MMFSATGRRDRLGLVMEVLSSAYRCCVGATPSSAVPKETLAVALRALGLHVRLGELEVYAWLTPDVKLGIVISGSCTWSPALERALHQAIEDVPAPIARLVLMEWAAVCELCARRPRGVASKSSRPSLSADEQSN